MRDVLLIQLAMCADYYMHGMPDGLAWYMQVHVKTRLYTQEYIIICKYVTAITFRVTQLIIPVACITQHKVQVIFNLPSQSVINIGSN